MACSVDVLTKKLEEIKISEEIFLGKDLSYEEKFLSSVIEEIEQEIEDCEVSYYLNKKYTTICYKSLKL